MPEAVAVPKPTKPSRPLERTPGNHQASASGPRLVRFQGCSNGDKSAEVAEPAAQINASVDINSKARNYSTAANNESVKKPPVTGTDSQPASFPQLGSPPASNLPPGQWHTAVDPTQSLSCLPGAPQAAVASQPLYPQCVSNYTAGFSSFHSPVTYIGPGPYPLQPSCQHAFYPNMAADYQNAAPPPAGVNFQPPVPDTTFGPMPHVYIPRFDGGFVPGGVHVGLPQLQFVQPPAFNSVMIPKTFYLNGYTYYQPIGAVPMQAGQAGYVVAPQPPYLPPHVASQQHVMMNGQTYVPVNPPPIQNMPPVAMGGVPAMGGPSIIPGNSGNPPEVAGVGRTPGEETARQLQFAHSNRLFEPQEFKPADDDPSRFYYVREVDGNWTQRNRFTIDHMGDCRWYVTDEGWFYAVRLPD